MTISIDLDCLSEDELYRIYTFLKLKFDVVERQQILAIDLADWPIRSEIDTRIINLLKFRRLNTLQDLAACHRTALQKINGMGPKGLQQIERLLHKYGLALAGQ